MNKKLLFVLMFGIFLFSFTFVSAQDLTIGTHDQQMSAYMTDALTINVLHPQDIKLNTDIYFYVSFYDKNGKLQTKDQAECILGILSPRNERLLLLTEDNMTFLYSDQIQKTYINGSFFNETGTYIYNYDCDAVIGGAFHGEMRVTINGEPKDNLQLYSRIFLILFCLLVIVAIQWNSKRVNYDKWYANLAKKYEKKNWTKFALGAVALNLMKNSWIFSYLVGLVGLLIITELTYMFNITSALQIMKIVLGLYSWSAIVVSLIFFSQVQEWIVGWLDDLQNLNWGIDKS